MQRSFRGYSYSHLERLDRPPELGKRIKNVDRLQNSTAILIIS